MWVRGERLTRKELQQIFYINKEIQMWQNELAKLRAKQLVGSPKITDMPKGGLIVGLDDYVADVADLEATIKGLLAKLQIKRKEIMEYIFNIDDEFIRQIVYLRNVCLMSWNEVANSIGGGNTENSVRMAYNRYFQKI